MEGSTLPDEVIHDYRSDIVRKKRKNVEYWKNWDSWNILYKTLAYETCSSRDVESYSYVRDSIIKLYDDNLVKYVGENCSFDVMNGWWYCFKKLFKLESRKSEKTKIFFDNMKRKIADKDKEADLINFLSKEYELKIKTVNNLLDFLEVVYTIGNIVPVPYGANKHGDELDSWEYKLSSFVKYKRDDYKEYFHFQEYKKRDIKRDKKSKDYTEDDICEYMETRIRLIENRGKDLCDAKKR